MSDGGYSDTPKPRQAFGDDRLERQLDFIIEVDKLKNVLRQTLLTDGSRHENDAEHSWHFALMAVLLAEYANEPGLDVAKTVKMALIHDIVEVDAGDTYCYDVQGYEDKAERETRAADRLYALLPEDQAAEFRALWEEFEAAKSPEARFAAALDRLQPLMHNYVTGGTMWQRHGVRREQVLERNGPIDRGSKRLWQYARGLIEDAVDKGYLEG